MPLFRFLVGLVMLAGCARADAALPDPRGADEGAVPDPVVEVLANVRHAPLGARMEAVSAPFLGFPYKVDPEGEGRGVDADPPARYDLFDCLTFIEEVLALALAPEPAGVPLVRNAFRYRDGVPAYENRRHFMMAQWLPDNVREGRLVDITAAYGEAQLLTRELTPDTWKWWKRRRLFQLPDEALPVGTFSLPVLSMDAALAVAHTLPAGTIVSTVRVPRPGVPIVVTHVSFVVAPRDGVPWMRHATRMGRQVVRDDRLTWYLEHLRWYRNWPVLGVNLTLPREWGPRAVADVDVAAAVY